MDYSTQINEKIAKNLSYYRKAAGLTQAGLAEKINYSDKSVSKWESGNGVPDIYILLQLAKLYGITLNELVGEEAPKTEPISKRKSDGLHLLIMLLSSGIVWLIATFLFVTLQFIEPDWAGWIVFLYAVPVNAILLIVYAGVWKYRLLNFASVSLLIWTVLVNLYLSLRIMVVSEGEYSALWCIFLLGVPLQALEILWVFFRSLLFMKDKTKKKKTKQGNQDATEEVVRKEENNEAGS